MLVVLRDVDAPVSVGDVRTDKPKEGERGVGKHGVAEPNGEFDNNETSHIRQDLATHDEESRFATHLRRHDVVKIGFCDGRRPNRASNRGNEQHGDRADDDWRRSAEGEHHQDRHQDDRDRQNSLDHSAENLINPASVVPHDQTQHCSDDDSHRCSNGRNNQNGASPVNNSRIDVPTVLICPKPGL